MSDFKIPDRKKAAGKVLGLGLLGGVGLVTYYYLLPFLLTIAWGTVELAVACAIGGVLLYILLNPTFWKRLKIILEAFGEILFKGFIEMNPFVIMEIQVKKAMEDRENLRKQTEKIKGQEARLRNDLAAEKKALDIAAEKIKICKSRMERNPNDFEAPLELDSASNDWNNANDFITNVTPIHRDMEQLIIIVDKAYIKSGFALKDLENRIKNQRRTYEAVTTGEKAMAKAMRAFTGDPEINRAATMAVEALNKDIANKMGAIKNSIKITNQIMNERDLNDAAKVNLAVKQAEALNVDTTFEVVSSTLHTPGINIPTPLKSNKYLNKLK